MTRHLASAVVAVVALASCGQASPPPPPPPTAVVAIPPAPSAAPTPVATPEPKPVEPPTESAESEESPRHTVAMTLKPGDPPCKLVFDGGLFSDHPEWFVITAVTRIATEEGGACASSVLYDVTTEKKRDPNDMDPEPLTAGIFLKPGQTLPADMNGEPVWNVAEDLNFDDYVDLCVVVMTGAYNYSQMCWLFDPQARTFKRQAALDPLIFMTVDRQKKKLASSYRAGGPVYQSNEYVWQGDKLVNVYASTSVLGEKLDGSPLPPGYDAWVIRRELRKGVMVKTFDGPIREKP